MGNIFICFESDGPERQQITSEDMSDPYADGNGSQNTSSILMRTESSKLGQLPQNLFLKPRLAIAFKFGNL